VHEQHPLVVVVKTASKCHHTSTECFPLQAVLFSDTARGLARVMANGDASACPALAAAILSICVIRSQSIPVLSQTSIIIMPALRDFLERVSNRVHNISSTCSNSTGVSPSRSRGKWPSHTTLSASEVHSAGLSGTDADAFYMGGALLHLMMGHISPEQSEVVEQIMLTVLEMLVRLLETPEHLEHLLPVSMALSLLGASLKASAKLQNAVICRGVVGKVRHGLS
jgi:hypothetical protein